MIDVRVKVIWKLGTAMAFVGWEVRYLGGGEGEGELVEGLVLALERGRFLLGSSLAQLSESHICSVCKCFCPGHALHLCLGMYISTRSTALSRERHAAVWIPQEDMRRFA